MLIGERVKAAVRDDRSNRCCHRKDGTCGKASTTRRNAQLLPSRRGMTRLRVDRVWLPMRESSFWIVRVYSSRLKNRLIWSAATCERKPWCRQHLTNSNDEGMNRRLKSCRCIFFDSKRSAVIPGPLSPSNRVPPCVCRSTHGLRCTSHAPGSPLYSAEQIQALGAGRLRSLP